jgi:cytochrome c5
MSDPLHDEAHSGPIRTPKQLLLTVIFSFVVPVFVIIGLVTYVVSASKPAGSLQAEKQALGGVTPQDLERGVAERIRKVGTVEIRDANRPLRAGEEVYKVQCASCHAAGVAGAPKFGDAGAWAGRIATGLDALVQSALKGKGAMPPQAGGDFDDVEIARGAVYMANAAGARFAEPQRPATDGQAAAASAPAAAAPATGAAAAPVAAPAPAAAPAAATADAAAGEALYKQACFACHAAGVAGAPKVGDKAAWAPRIQQGMPALVQSAIKGKGAMPPKGGSAAPDAQVEAAVNYMVTASK